MGVPLLETMFSQLLSGHALEYAYFLPVKIVPYNICTGDSGGEN